jgi:hypothetical protein
MFLPQELETVLIKTYGKERQEVHIGSPTSNRQDCDEDHGKPTDEGRP